tara:strand:+ start:16942 stop:17130 length:189 start_codon:yes stop_codon:yes gene_type:complete
MKHPVGDYDYWEAKAREWMAMPGVTKSEIECCISGLRHSKRPILEELIEAKKKAKTFKDLMG